MKAKILLALATTVLCCTVNAELVNDFNCTLNPDQSRESLFQFQAQWMAAAREHGFDENYKTRILFPVYNEKTGSDPLYFIWRGHFADGEQWGRMTDWFMTSEWAPMFDGVMTCTKASLWYAPL